MKITESSIEYLATNLPEQGTIEALWSKMKSALRMVRNYAEVIRSYPGQQAAGYTSAMDFQTKVIYKNV